MEELFPTDDVLSDESKKIIKLLETYQIAQSAILYSEEVDPTSASNLQINKEMRDTLDHLMRIYNHKLNSQNMNRDLLNENYEKAIGHLYRATFDALDGTVMSVSELISHSLNKYTAKVLSEVIPDYWKMRKEILSIKSKVSNFRAYKDVGEKSNEMLNSYIAEVDVLDGFYKEILENGPQLDEYEKQLRGQNIKKRIIDISVAIIATVIGGLILVKVL